MIPLLSGEMAVVKRAGSGATTWSADVDRAAAKPPAKKGPQVRLGNVGATSTRAVIISSAFIVFIAIALLIGGHAAIDPFLHSDGARDPRAASDIVVTMPDGKFCRHMTFDNATASMVEGTIAPCKVDITRDSGSAAPTPPRGFMWGVH
jgi:hypothetical protein